MNTLNSDVTKFLDTLNHPLRAEIDQLRTVILNSNDGFSENIKWNGPNYSVGGQDRVTMRIQPPTQVQLVFHRGAKKLEQPKSKTVDDNYSLLVWKENDRAVASFKNMPDIERSKAVLVEILNRWIIATT